MMTRPDGLLGAIIASESLGLTVTMINGSGGCRSRSQIMLHELIPSYYPEDQACCRSKYFSRQSRLPCTYLNGNDIIFGAEQKISEGLESVTSITGRRAVLLDTLGVSLICTDLSGLELGSNGPIHIGKDLSSMELTEGYDLTVRTILENMDLEGGRDGSVNILGYSIMDLGWESGADELCGLLESMGVKVNCVLGCLPDESSVKNIGKASLNILIHPEHCMGTARMLQERFGTPYLRPSKGAPVGYPAIRSFVKEVADASGLDPTPALDSIQRDADRVHGILLNYDRMARSMHSRGFTAEGDSSTVYPLTEWMIRTFGMVPRRISLYDEEYLPEIRELLSSYGLEGALDGTDGVVEVMFCNDLDALESRMTHSPIGKIGICIPHGRSIDLMGRTLVGTKGCRYILDEMFNNMVRFRCGQPTDMMFRE